MQIIGKIIKTQLREMQQLLKESKSSTQINLKILSLFYVGIRLSILLPTSQFANENYKDEKFILIKTLINWFTVLSPINSMNNHNIIIISVILISIFHWISTLIIIFGNFESKILHHYSQKYFTYLNSLLLYPTFIHIQNLKYIGDFDEIVIVSIIPVIFNSTIQNYIQRNYSLPTRNPFVKRHRNSNYMISLIEMIGLVSIVYLQEQYQCVILILIFFVQLLDALFVNPYQYYVNLQYCFWSSLLFFASLFKMIVFFWNAYQFFYLGIYLIPLLSFVVQEYFQLQQDDNLIQNCLQKELLLQIVDMYYSGNEIIKNKILYIIRTKYKIIIKEKFDIDLQLQQCIMQLFTKIIEQLNMTERYQDEDFYIYKILFFLQTCEKQNLGYIKMKKFQSSTSSQSLYFQILADNIYNSVVKNRKRRKINQLNEDSQNSLSLSEIRASQLLHEKSMSFIAQILQMKLKYWERLQQGYQKIEELAKQSENLSNLLIKLKNLVFCELQINVFSIQKDLFKLNILDLRLLSLIFSGVLNDFHITLEIEQRIEELLSFERNLQSRNILNTNLLNDEMILVSVSMLKNQGQIMVSNRTRMQKFFQYPTEDSFMQIQHINQLLPKYLQEKHDEFMNNFLKIGESDLFDQSRDVFPIYQTGFSFNSTLQLVHSYDNLDDYIVTAAIKQVNENTDFIIFDDTGKILGISKSVQNILLSNNRQEFDDQILKSYIFFWFHNLFDQVQQFQQEQQNDQINTFKINSQKTFVTPIQDIDIIIREHETYKKSHLITQTSALKTEQQENTYYQIQSLPKYTCFKKNYVQQTQEFVSSCSLKENSIHPYYQIVYNLILNVMKNKYPYFLMQITEYRYKDVKKQGLEFSNSAISSFYHSKNLKTSDQIEDEYQLDDNEGPLNFVINQPVVNKLLINDQDDDIYQEAQLNQNQPQQKSIDPRESNLVSPRGNRDILIQKEYDYDEEEEDGRDQNSKVGKSSSQKNQQADILQVVLREQNLEQNDLHKQNKKSVTSATSDKTQNSVYNLIRKLTYSEQFQTSIIKSIIISIVLTLMMIILIISEIQIARSNTDQLKYDIPLVRIPQRFNRLYCTFVTLGQLDLQLNLLNQSYGDFYEYRIKNESVIRRIEMLNMMLDLKNEFAKLEQENRLPIVAVRIINEYSYQELNVTMIQFDSMVNEYTERINQYLQGSDEIRYVEKIQVLVQFLKGNLINQLNLTIKLVEEIENEFFNLIDYFETEYFIFLLVLLWIIFFMLMLQFRQWHQPYIYMQTVLLLISRITEKDIEYSCQKISFISNMLDKDQQLWKHINYFREYFWFSRTITHTSIKYTSSSVSQLKQTSKSNTSRVKSVSRIQETNFSILNIYLMLFFLWVLLSGYILSTFLIMKQNMEDSQPELRLAMEYVRFKQDLDGVMIISQLLKNQQILIDETMASGVFHLNPELSTKDKYFSRLYAELLNQFVILQKDSTSVFEHIYNDIVASKKISSANKDLLLKMYETDLCLIIPSQLPFCEYENGQFKHFPTYPSAQDIDNNRMLYKYGINGIFQNIQQIFTTHYSLELNGIKDTNLILVNQFLQSPEFIQVILSYTFDISFALLEFYYTIIQASLDILEDDYQMIVTYVASFGFGALITFYLVILIRATTLQQKVQSIRQALIIIPHESLQDQSILNAIRKIDRTL
ncbi:unnamed protein product [Paramecium primaurelia]|uniref:Uncharacterized protein n=1 Tax=Paramecium primaurelia TaxID=5886 RepID=A0A8S1NT35_PARPR|nr:unnamed protein product [Paramecium primaurelia]